MENVKHVVLPEGLKEIGFYAFGRDTLESVVIPDSIEVIENDALGILRMVVGLDPDLAIPQMRTKTEV